MKKLFRFKYEPCSGTCYCPGDKFFEELNKFDEDGKKQLINKIVSAHDSTCDDPNQLFAIDYDENVGVYIGTVFDNGRLDLFSDKSFVSLVDALTSFVKKQNEGRASKSGNCVYGASGIEDLANIILKQCA